MASASVLPSGRTTSLLEREAQVAALEALTDAARSGGGRFAVIEGGAGIGKTRLLAEARAIASCGGDAGARRPRGRVGERVCVRDRPSAVRAAACLRLSRSPRRPALGACRAHGTALRNLGARRFTSCARRGLLRAHARSLLARGQRGRSAADIARDRRPVLGRYPLPALAPLPDAKARGGASSRRRGDPAAGGERAAIPCLS